MRVKCASVLFNTIIIAGTVFIIHIFESLYSYSRYNYDSFFSVYSDNIGKRSQFEELSPILPIDAVYTWVNGSDPNMLLQLRATKNHLIETGQLLKLNVSGEGKIYSSVHDTSTDKTKIKCLLRDCVEMKLVVFEATQKTSNSVPISKKDVMMAYPETNAAVRFITPSVEKYSNFSNILIAEIFHDATREAILEKKVDGIQAYQAFLTTTTMLQYALPWSEAIVFSNLQPDFKEEHQISKSLPADISKGLIKIEVHGADKVAVVNFLEESFAVDSLNYFYQNPAVLGQVQINPGFLLWNLKKIEPDPEWLSASRFADNEELRYSLRSLEKFAPWIRHVFIVTNGQIPAWLDLESPRLTIVTHDQLFPSEEGYLPTFSSPAIESQLHKIPGLSKHFLYFNDDVMLGQAVYPQDFFSHQSGYKIYPGWPVPSCRDDCPNAWLHDGYCDAACNNVECDFDGGDCLNVNAASGNLQANGGIGGGAGPHLGGGDGPLGGWRDQDTGCSYSCSDSWLGDRYCDVACNKRVCGFDMGDCGISGLMKLNMYNVDTVQIHSTASSSLSSISFNHNYNEVSFAFNLSSFLVLEKQNVSKVYYDRTAYVRAVKFLKGANVIQVVLSRVSLQTSSPNISIHVELTSKSGNAIPAPVLNITTLLYSTETKKNINSFINRSAEIDVETINVAGKNPKVAAVLPSPKAKKSASALLESLENFNMALLPSNVSKVLEKFRVWLNEKIVSKSVYEEIVSDLLAPYLNLLQQQHSNGQHGLSDKGKKHEKEKKAEKKKGAHGEKSEKDTHHKAASRIDVLPAADEQQRQLIEKTKYQKQSIQKVEANNTKHNEDNRQQEQEWLKFIQQDYSNKNDDDEKTDKKIGQLEKGSEKESVQSFNSRKLQSVNSDQESGKHIGGAVIESELNENEAGRGRVANGSVDVGKLNDNAPVEAAGLAGAAAAKQNLAPADLTKDAFRDSLRYVNKLYDKEFGSSTQRMVISHMPHFINKDIMTELQARFPEEFEQTAKHKLRMGTDMQFAFSYFEYIISVKESSDYLDMFNMFDSDNSGVLSDRELRVLATYIYPTPISLDTMNSFESGLRDCANLRAQSGIVEEPPRNPETYFSQNMPQVTAMLLFNCRQMLDRITAHFSALPKYKHRVMSDVGSQVMFKMLPTNLSSLIGMLDEVRHNRKKFICLNDNFDHNQQDAPVARAVVQDFYEGLYPLQSQFELPREYRNRFLHLDDLKTWQSFRWKLKFWSHILLGVLVVISIGSYIQERVSIVYHKVSGAPAPGIGLLPK